MGFYSEDTLGLYPRLPSDLVEVSAALESEYRQYISEGKVPSIDSHGTIIWELVVDTEDVVFEERYWRNSELIRSDIELYKVQDADSKSRGSVSDWRNYRKELRSWPENAQFPNKNYRPIAPDA